MHLFLGLGVFLCIVDNGYAQDFDCTVSKLSFPVHIYCYRAVRTVVYN